MNAISVHAPDLLPQPVSIQIYATAAGMTKRSMRTTHHPDRTEFCDQPDGERSEGLNLIARQYLMQFCPDAVFRKWLSNWK